MDQQGRTQENEGADLEYQDGPRCDARERQGDPKDEEGEQEQEYLVRLAPEGWKEKHKIEIIPDAEIEEQESVTETAVGTREQKSTWARLIKKVYDVDPLVCPKCFSPMKIM